MTKPTKPTVPPAPSRANPGPVFSQAADTFAAFQAPFADYLDALAEFVDERADEALAAALAGDLPPLTGQGGSFPRAKPDDTALEFRTPTQVRSDLSINGIGSETAPTVTNLSTLTVAGEYFIDSFVSGIVGHAAEPATVKMYAADATTRAAQEAIGLTSGRKWRRVEAAGAWGAWTEFQNALGFTPVEQGGGANMGADKIRLGWDAGAGNPMLRAQVDVTQLGALVYNASAVDGIANGQMFAPGDPPLYACRAWVNFNGENGAIRASGNVSSVVRHSPSSFTINFTTPMPDANYVVAGFCNTRSTLSNGIVSAAFDYSPTAGGVRIGITSGDATFINVAIIR
jgi:hypothetical protein